MIEASVRFNRGLLGQIFFGDLQLTEDGRTLTPVELVNRAEGKKVLILIHGYHTPYPGALDSFLLIEDEAEKRGIHYDLVIGFFWPGSPITLGFLPGVMRARKAGQRLLKLLYWLSNWTAVESRVTIDIETHSLGAQVALTALSDTHARCRNLLLTGPAVEASCFNPGKRYTAAVEHCERVDVFYSQRDEVLGVAMPCGEFWIVDEGGALGFQGPLWPKGIVQIGRIGKFDLSADVADHSGYKRSPAFYSQWATRCEKHLEVMP